MFYLFHFLILLHLFFSLIKASSVVLEIFSLPSWSLKYIKIKVESCPIPLSTVYNLLPSLIFRFCLAVVILDPVDTCDPGDLNPHMYLICEGCTLSTETVYGCLHASVHFSVSSVPDLLSSLSLGNRLSYNSQNSLGLIFFSHFTFVICLNLFPLLWFPRLAYSVGGGGVPVYRVIKLTVGGIRSLWAFPWLADQAASCLALFHTANSSWLKCLPLECILGWFGTYILMVNTPFTINFKNNPKNMEFP